MSNNVHRKLSNNIYKCMFYLFNTFNRFMFAFTFSFVRILSMLNSEFIFQQKKIFRLVRSIDVAQYMHKIARTQSFTQTIHSLNHQVKYKQPQMETKNRILTSSSRYTYSLVRIKSWKREFLPASQAEISDVR